MKYVKRYLDNAGVELTKASRRINTLIKSEKLRKDCLERSYEDQWGNVGGGRAEEYGDMIIDTQDKIESLEEIKRIVDDLEKRVSNFNESRLMNY